MTGDDSRQDIDCNGSGPANTEPPHILLIEDDEVMREMLAEALRHAGYRVTESVNAFRWLESCVHQAATNPAGGRQQLYDAVVSDIRMPNMSGLDVLRILRDIRCDKTCPPTILITAFGDSRTHDKAHELGVVAVLDKPFPIRYLVEKIREVTDTATPDKQNHRRDADTQSDQ